MSAGWEGGGAVLLNGGSDSSANYDYLYGVTILKDGCKIFLWKKIVNSIPLPVKH